MEKHEAAILTFSPGFKVSLKLSPRSELRLSIVSIVNACPVNPLRKTMET
jgi:hypothetical protein